MVPPHITWPAQPMVLPRVGPVHVPVVDDREQPAVLTARPQQEPADHALAALVVPVEQVDGQQIPARDRLRRGIVRGIAGITERALPEAGVARRYVEVPGLPGEPPRVGMLVAAVVPRVEPPAVQYRDPVAGVTQRQGQV